MSETIQQGPQQPAKDKDVVTLTPTYEPPMEVTHADRVEAVTIGYLGPESRLLEWLAAHRRMKRDAYVLLAQKDAELQDFRKLVDGMQASFAAEKELREKAELERDALLNALGWKLGSMDRAPDIILQDAAALRPEMVKARRKSDDLHFEASMYRVFMSEESGLLLKLWNGYKSFRTSADAELATLRKRVEDLEADVTRKSNLIGNAVTDLSEAYLRAEKAEAELSHIKAEIDMVDGGADETGFKECPRWRVTRQARIGRWCAEAFGTAHAMSLPQRGIRHLEEAAEAAQATGVDLGMAHKLLDHVWSRPVGNLAQELGGVAVTLLALAHAAGLNAEECEAREIRRVLNKPLSHFAKRNAEKNAAGFNVELVSTATEQSATEAGAG